MWKSLFEMFRRFTRSLSFKYSFYAGLIMFLAVVAFTYRMISSQEEALVQERIRGALKDTEVIKAAIWNGMMTKNREVIRQIVQAIGSQEGFKDIRLYDQHGVLHYTSGEAALADVGKQGSSKDNPLLEGLQTNPNQRYRFVEQGNTLNVVNPILNAKGCSASACHRPPAQEPILGALEVSLQLQGLRHRIRDDRRETLVFAFGLFIVISSIIGLATIWGVIPPIRRLQANARNMARGLYKPLPQNYGSDELAELAHSFDEMSWKINESTRQLNESRKLYKELFEKVPCYLTAIGPDFRIVRVNEAYKNEFGDHAGEICFEAFKRRKSKCPDCAVEKTFSDGLPHRCEEVWTIGTGKKKTSVIINTAPIIDAEGKVTEVLEMAVDVTRLQRLQDELREKEQHFRTLFQTVPCYLTVLDSSYRIAFYNKKFSDDFGDCWGRHCYKVYKGRNTRCENCPVEKTFADGGIYSSEELWHFRGEDRYIVVQTAPIMGPNGQVVAVIEMFNDITELKVLRNELAVLGETIAAMSHDVKNILAGLEGGVYVVDSGLRSGREEKVRTGWDMVKRNVEKVSDLVKGILYASKEREPEYTECDPGAVLRDVCDLYEGRARASSVDLIRDFRDEMGVALLDPKGIHSAVSNLVSNAIEACRMAGTNGLHHVTVYGRMQSGWLSLQVIDDGEGMPDEVMQSLFKRFYSTKGSKGTGLGLVVTRKIVEEHGGTIKVQSEHGKGTTFLIDIPLKQANEEPIVAQG